jgi:hypothetical protein
LRVQTAAGPNDTIAIFEQKLAAAEQPPEALAALKMIVN